eukprot:COSAG05_NODE_6871_length_889_cov_2.701266_1_plen_63_part_10
MPPFPLCLEFCDPGCVKRYSENESGASDIIERNCWIHACAHMHEFILINYLLYFYMACHGHYY